MKKVLYLLLPLFMISCGDGDGNENGNSNVDPNDPLIGSWKQISFEFYATLLEGEQTGRACIEEGYPSEAQFFSDGTFNDQFWECSDNPDGTVEIEEWDPTEGGTWEQVGEAGNYLITDPNEEEPNDEVAYLEFNADFSRFSDDNGESITTWERQ